MIAWLFSPLESVFSRCTSGCCSFLPFFLLSFSTSVRMMTPGLWVGHSRTSTLVSSDYACVASAEYFGISCCVQCLSSSAEVSLFFSPSFFLSELGFFQQMTKAEIKFSTTDLYIQHLTANTEDAPSTGRVDKPSKFSSCFEPAKNICLCIRLADY